MNLTMHNSIVPAAAVPRGLDFAIRRSRPLSPVALLRAALGAAATSLALAGHAFAAGTASTAGIGAQVANMTQEGSNAAGNAGSMAMYAAALVCLVGGAWALWQSRQPQNRESGKVTMGAAGLVLCGLFATGGVWIGKAANTASGGNASVTSTAGLVQFGNSGGAAQG